MKKPDCYKCKYRGSVPGSAHSRCNHPNFKNTDPMLEIMAIFASVGRVSPIPPNSYVKGNPAGIKKGWFNHPFNFDPIWLEECSLEEVIKKSD